MTRSSSGEALAKPAPDAEGTGHQGVFVSMVLLRLAVFQSELLVTFHLPAPRPAATAAADPPLEPPVE